MVHPGLREGRFALVIRTIVIHRWSLFRQMLPSDVYFWAKALLLACVAVQLSRLLWVLVTPVGPFNDWTPRQARLLPVQAQTSLLAVVDPFFRQGATDPAAPAQFPSIELGLFGVREERGAGGGSAIIGPPGGEQRSYVVGEEVSPGVKLAAVFFDFVVLDAGGQQQKLYMDGSSSGQAAPASAPAPGAAPATAGTLTAEAARRAIRLAPRSSGGRITGVMASPGTDSASFAAAGLRPGDVIVAVNGARISSQTDLVQLQSSLAPGARLSLSVERGAGIVPVALNIAGK